MGIKEVADKIEPKLYKFLNETYFSLALLILSGFGQYVTLALDLSSLQVIAFIFFKVSTIFFLGTTFTKFLNGIGFDINTEIFKENSTASAILLGLIWVAIAIGVSFGNLG